MHLARIIVAACLFAFVVSGRAADVAGSADHPVVSRYAGSTITAYQTSDFEEFPLLVEKATQYGGLAKNEQAVRRLEGRVTRITYRAPDGRTTTEVFRNYKSALEGAGFEILFACADQACGGRNFNHAASPRHAYMAFGENYRDQRYLAAKLQRSSGDVYVAVYTVAGARGAVHTQLDVVEVAAMQAGKVTVDAEAMAQGLEADGHIALYSLYFDSGEARLQPESAPALAEIAKLLRSQPDLRLLVVGHTDSVGELAYNEDLSRRRAQAVVRALLEQHGIDKSRLHAAGVGMYAPVASNAGEPGRALNRRVELVKW